MSQGISSCDNISTKHRSNVLKAPFPWFGGKSRVADVVWRRFGDVPNYVEPFAGSLAVLLGRRNFNAARHTETVNDKDSYLVNFWRAVQAEPDAVAQWADWPVSEADLLARHQWLIDQDLDTRMKTDPNYCDVQIAGWWVWGLCSWIGGGWCRKPVAQLPHLGDRGQGINRKLPHLGDRGQGISLYFTQLMRRLENVRICAGDWARVLGPSVTEKNGTTGVFLDPPYDDNSVEYAGGGGGIASEVARWAIENGTNPNLRIAYCGYADTVSFPDSWSEHAWKNRGGYGSRSNGQGKQNATRERIWFSPYCLQHQGSLFEPLERPVYANGWSVKSGGAI